MKKIWATLGGFSALAAYGMYASRKTIPPSKPTAIDLAQHNNQNLAPIFHWDYEYGCSKDGYNYMHLFNALADSANNTTIDEAKKNKLRDFREKIINASKEYSSVIYFPSIGYVVVYDEEKYNRILIPKLNELEQIKKFLLSSSSDQFMNLTQSDAAMKILDEMSEHVTLLLNIQDIAPELEDKIVSPPSLKECGKFLEKTRDKITNTLDAMQLLDDLLEDEFTIGLVSTQYKNYRLNGDMQEKLNRSHEEWEQIDADIEKAQKAVRLVKKFIQSYAACLMENPTAEYEYTSSVKTIRKT
ncbi:MAG: hypothetical protein SFW66_02035 [Gammaproteobacteria bacterium]|nr:hypothetical protein [Gammaproteobacteria bacterium]